MDIEHKGFFFLRGIKDITTATQKKLLAKKTLEEIMELAEQIYPVQSTTYLKRKAVILVAVQ